jgi:hypothetical protein
MSNRALQHAADWEWDPDDQPASEAVIDPDAEREWQELLAWARESGALQEPIHADGPAGAQEDEEWGWQLARAKATSSDAA